MSVVNSDSSNFVLKVSSIVFFKSPTLICVGNPNPSFKSINSKRWILKPIVFKKIKKMKEIKKDILEIIPKLQNSQDDDENDISIQEKSFEEIFREFYKKERNVEADDEIVSLLLKLINEEGDENETN